MRMYWRDLVVEGLVTFLLTAVALTTLPLAWLCDGVLTWHAFWWHEYCVAVKTVFAEGDYL